MPQYPKRPGTCADKLYELREEIRQLQQQIDRSVAAKRLEQLKKQFDGLYAHTLGILNQQRLEKAAGTKGQVSKYDVTYYTVEDFERVLRYTVKTKAWDLVPKRVSKPAVKARLEDGKDVPGVNSVTEVKLSITKKG